MLCADLICVHWKDQSGRAQKSMANLEDISLSGVCIQMDNPLPPDTAVRITSDKVEFEGTARYCVFRETGYFIGVQFESGCTWSQRQFRPKHLLDPRKLMAVNTKRAGRSKVQ
jgi:hypothetical protein